MRVGEGVDGGDKEVEAQAPICQNGEVAEILLGCYAALSSACEQYQPILKRRTTKI